MAWNRRKRVRLARSAWVGRLVLVSIAVAGLALWYVWLKVRMVDLGYQIRDLERRVSSVKKENQVLRMKISQMKSPKNIEAMIRNKEMNLTATKNSQVVVLSEMSQTGPLKTFVPQGRGPALFATLKHADPPAQIPLH